MKPKRVRVRNYKSIEDTGWVEVDDLTCLIGKNESGKTVLMEALSRLNPARGEGEFEPYEDYPRRRWSDYSDRHEDDPDPVVSVELALDPEERSRLEEHGGHAPDGTVVVTKDYANVRHWELEVDEDLDADEVGEEVLASELPTFHYIGEYNALDASIDLDAFAERVEAGDRTASDRVFESLLSVAELSVDSLRQEGWRETLTELEAASSEVTSTVTNYWSQADDVAVRLRGIDGDSRTVEVRVENPHHGVTVEFDQRSQGFRWFFSTFCTLFALRETNEEVVLLLDEPGLHLHPKAKREFLSFLDHEIAAAGTVVYSTHSPFMIDLERAHRTLMIHKDPETGSTVLTDPDDADPYTRFPLQNVFELGVMETMVARSQLLLVEDGTTYEYLYNVSELLEDSDAPVVDRGWTVLPIGTLENTATVRSVFDTGDKEVAIVHDGDELDGTQPPGDVTVVGIGSHAPVDGNATIEDLLSESFYLELVNRAYAGALAEASGAPDRVTRQALAETAPSGPIVERLERHFVAHGIANGTFDRSRPATYLQRHRGEFASEVDMDTRKAFGSLARELNRTLGSFEGERKTGFLESLFGR